MVEMIYCSWIDNTAPESEFPAACKPVVGGICNRCQTSEQIKLGMKPSELLRNIREG